MESNIKEEYIKVYKPLVIQFLNEIEDVDINNISEPFLPIFGENYGIEQYKKIAFVGIELGSGWRNISDFVKQVTIDKDLEGALFRNSNAQFKDCDFYVNNSGTDFSACILKFLARLYNIDDWEKLKNTEDHYMLNILKSFVWGNANAIEQYHLCSQKKGVKIENWQKVKQASLIFDKAKYLINIFKPNILIVLNWPLLNGEWLSDDIECEEKNYDVHLDDHLRYFYLNKTNTHVYWTAHPSWLKFNEGFEKINEKIFDDMKSKNIV